MKFVYPHWLWALAGIPVLFIFLLWDESLRKKRFLTFAAEKTWSFLAPDLDFKARLRKGYFWLAAVAFVFIALARPQWGTHEEKTKVSGLDVMLVLDISNSMEVEDTIPNRLQKAKHEVRSLVERLQGDRVGVVAFAASAQVACPLTTDLSYLLDTVQILTPALALSQGTDIGLGLETARKSIERGAEELPKSDLGSQSSQAIILISDGEDQEDSAQEVARKLSESGIRLYIIGVGSQKGGPIPVRDENGNLVGHKKDSHGQAVVSTFRPDALVQLATLGKGKYWNATDNETEVEQLLQDLGGMNRTEFSEKSYIVFEDRFQYPLLIAVLLLLFEFSLSTKRRGKKGEIVSVLKRTPLTIAVMTLFLAQVGHAAPLKAYLENEKGIQSLKDGKAEEAKRQFGTAQAVAPHLPELDFNQGVVQLQQGDADAAILSFQESVKKSLDKDPAMTAKSLYNLGVAQTKKGDFKGAVNSYLGAIGESEKANEAQVGAEARKNLELLAQEQQKQKQKKDDDKKKDDQKKDPKQDQKKDEKNEKDKASDPKKEPGKQEKPNEEKNKKDQKQEYQEPKKQDFKSQKLTPDDADRVMEELKHREKELQTKLKKKNVRQDNVNDW